MFRSVGPSAVGFAAAFLLGACAAPVKTAPVSLLTAANTAMPDVVLSETTSFKMSTGYGRALPEGSRWRHVGTVPQGDVYRPVGSVLTVEGRNRHEAYLVVADGDLFGFYLPGEGNYAPLPNPVNLTIRRPE